MPELTDRARRNLERGGVTGPGTAVCRGCSGPKEATRLNSAQCRGCGEPGRTVQHSLKVSLPGPVLAALTAEATKYDQTPAERVAFLLTRKYRG